MNLADVNVLVNAFRPDAPEHQRYKLWLEAQVNGRNAFGIAPQVLGSVVRICTHPRVFARPSKLEEVFAFCRALLEHPNATLIVPQQRHWSIFQSLCVESRATGNLVPDAWFAALAIEAGCSWISEDGDYARFKDLDWQRLPHRIGTA